MPYPKSSASSILARGASLGHSSPRSLWAKWAMASAAARMRGVISSGASGPRSAASGMTRFYRADPQIVSSSAWNSASLSAGAGRDGLADKASKNHNCKHIGQRIEQLNLHGYANQAFDQQDTRTDNRLEMITTSAS